MSKSGVEIPLLLPVKEAAELKLPAIRSALPTTSASRQQTAMQADLRKARPFCMAPSPYNCHCPHSRARSQPWRGAGQGTARRTSPMQLHVSGHLLHISAGHLPKFCKVTLQNFGRSLYRILKGKQKLNRVHPPRNLTQAFILSFPGSLGIG